MELSGEQKLLVISVLRNADGEDLDEIIESIGMEDYLLHSLMMRASQDEIDYYLEERKNILPLLKK